MNEKKIQKSLNQGKYGIKLFNLKKLYKYIFYCRMHNKGVYVKMGLKKMIQKSKVKEFNDKIRLEVDGRVVTLPPVEGIIILNIQRFLL